MVMDPMVKSGQYARIDEEKDPKESWGIKEHYNRNTFDGFINKLNIAEKRINELKEMSVET